MWHHLGVIKYLLFDSFAFNLARVATAATNAMARRLAPYDITPVQWGVLAGLKEKDGVTPTELMLDLERDLPSTLRVIWKLEKKGFVRRECNPADRRSYIVHLTPEGRALWERLVPVVLQLNQDAYGHLDPAYVEQVKQTTLELRTIYDSMLKE
ncbi:MarR family winged helix-turn-helix transcriptional regulator [Holophaga foetida]|uniref:MarR family winged helix-turn-helix transcriptional regulator n=1 Tax=Holophaga foetida TaxID=35839 RepID=UPI0002474A0A|nr:MarR family transcriptional regulator [Holophaga foetida]